MTTLALWIEPHRILAATALEDDGIAARGIVTTARSAGQTAGPDAIRADIAAAARAALDAANRAATSIDALALAGAVPEDAIALAEPRDLPREDGGSARAGRLSADAAEALDLPPGVPATLGLLPAAAAAAGCADAIAGSMISCASEAGFNAILAGDAPTPAAVQAERARYDLVRWFLDAAFQDAGGFDRADRAELDAVAGAIPPGSGGSLALPGAATASGDRTPGHVCFGMSNQTNRGQMLRAVYEGLAHATRQSAENLGATGAKRLIWLGYGAESRLIPQMLADVCDLPVHCPRTAEAVLRGAARLAAQGPEAGDPPPPVEATDAAAVPDADMTARYAPWSELARRLVQTYGELHAGPMTPDPRRSRA